MTTAMKFLSVAALLALGSSQVGGPTWAHASEGRKEAAENALAPLSPTEWDLARARHLLSRAGFGDTPEEVAKLHALGLQRAVDSLVDYASQPDLVLPVPIELERQPLPDPKQMTPQQLQAAAQQRRQQDQLQMVKVREWWIQRMIQSPRPLQEKLTLFWHGHFATEYRTVRDSVALYKQNQLFREHAAGSFGKLLHAIVHDPAMLRYLDNNRNVKGRPNENLAREIMELFSLGEGNYSEQDIKEAARALTGYTFERASGNFQFVKAAHDQGPKTIFGKTGNWNGDQLVDLILERPAAARFLARKLFGYFVHDEPDDPAVEVLARLLRKENYQLAPVLKTLFASRQFYGERAMGTQIKSPVQLVVGTVRILGLPQIEPARVAAATRAMAQDLFEPPNVRGWEGGRAWVNTNSLFVRQNFAAQFITRGAGPGAAKTNEAQRNVPAGVMPAFDVAAQLEAKKLFTSGPIVDYFATTLFAVPLPESRRAELRAFVGTLPPATDWADRKQQLNARLRDFLVLMLGMPEFQLT